MQIGVLRRATGATGLDLSKFLTTTFFVGATGFMPLSEDVAFGITVTVFAIRGLDAGVFIKSGCFCDVDAIVFNALLERFTFPFNSEIKKNTKIIS